MGKSKYQYHREVVCNCGCGKKFSSFPIYASKQTRNNPDDFLKIKTPNTILHLPKFMAGHNPRLKATQFDGSNSWNKGLTKETNSSVAKQGAKGKDHFYYDPKQNPDFFDKDYDHVYYSRKYGQKARSKGNKFYAKLVRAIRKRDKYTCQECGRVVRETDSPYSFNVHHIVPASISPDDICNPKNLIFLCIDCHWQYHKANK